MADKQLWQVTPVATDVKNDDGVIIGGQTAGTRCAPLTLIANYVHNLWAAFINAITPLKTSFANGDKFPVVNGSTATAMEASTLLELTAQNALGSIKNLPTKYKGFMALDDADGTGKMDVDIIFNNFAGKFEDNVTEAKADKLYMHNGTLYVAKEDYIGVWDASKFEHTSCSQMFLPNTNVQDAVSKWLDEHPEATTTIENGSVTDDKLNSSIRFNRLASYSNKGYKLLKSTDVFSDVVVNDNTIYELRWEFDLLGERVYLPDGCVLFFNGGSLNNGTLIGTFEVNSNSDGIFNNIQFEDCNTPLKIGWLHKPSSYLLDDSVDDTDGVDYALNCGAQIVYFENELYRVTRTIEISSDVNIYGPTDRHLFKNARNGFLSVNGIYTNYDGTILRFIFPDTGNRRKKNVGGFSVHQFSNTDQRNDSVALVEFTTADAATIWGLDIDIDVINHCDDTNVNIDGQTGTENMPKCSYTGIYIYPSSTNGSLITFVKVSGCIHKCFTGVKAGKVSDDTSSSWITSLTLDNDSWCVHGAKVDVTPLIINGTHQSARAYSYTLNDNVKGYFIGRGEIYLNGYVWDLASSDGVSASVTSAVEAISGQSQTDLPIIRSNQPVLNRTYIPENSALKPFQNFGMFGNILTFGEPTNSNGIDAGSARSAICSVSNYKFIKTDDSSVSYDVAKYVRNYKDIFNLCNLISNFSTSQKTAISGDRCAVNSRLFYVLEGTLWNSVTLTIDVRVDFSKITKKSELQNLIIQHQMWNCNCVLQLYNDLDQLVYENLDYIVSGKYASIFSTNGIISRDLYTEILGKSASYLVLKFSFDMDLGGNVFSFNLPVIGLITNYSDVLTKRGGCVTGGMIFKNLKYNNENISVIETNELLPKLQTLSNLDTFYPIAYIRHKAAEGSKIWIYFKINNVVCGIIVSLGATYRIYSIDGNLPYNVVVRVQSYASGFKDFNGYDYYVTKLEVKDTENNNSAVFLDSFVFDSSFDIVDSSDIVGNLLDNKLYAGLKGGVTKYDSQNGKMILYNGSSWVNMDGTSL